MPPDGCGTSHALTTNSFQRSKFNLSTGAIALPCRRRVANSGRMNPVRGEKTENLVTCQNRSTKRLEQKFSQLNR